VQQGVQQEEVGHVRELFSLCDKNGDGSIDMVRADEFVSFILSMPLIGEARLG
jgi:Ca2+-binding EF-hand superfamily protein